MTAHPKFFYFDAGVFRSGDLKPLKSFRDDYPECMTLMLYRGTSPMVIDGIMCMPVDRFLQELHPDKELSQQKAQ